MFRFIHLIIWILLSSPLVSQKMEMTYRNLQDTLVDCYMAISPDDRPIKACLVLIDGFGMSKPKDVLVQTDLPIYAAKQGILTIIPTLKTGGTFFAVDEASQSSLKEIVEEVVVKYKLSGKNLYIGGFSIGGTCALKYAQLANQLNYTIKPKAVFAVDSPLDWERFYNASMRIKRISKQDNVTFEVKYMLDRIVKEMGGEPKNALNNYHKYSPYSLSDTSQANIKHLIDTPIMCISEPDVNWWLQNRGYDFDNMNISDMAGMINELKRLGNDRATLVTTVNKGYRQPDLKRHPHSWSIADPSMVLKWLLSQ